MENKEATVWIVGANFENKGAQSMLFIVVDELKKALPDCEIFFAGGRMPDEWQYTFRHLFLTRQTCSIALAGRLPVAAVVRCFLKDCVKFVVGRRDNLWRFLEARRELQRVGLMIDVSGFGLGDQWTERQQELYLAHIRLAMKRQIPVYLMPQSFGPFERTDRAKLTLKTMELLRYPQIIFTREKAGYEWLHDCFGLRNVKMSTDLVLQNKGIDENNLYRYRQAAQLPYVEKDAVGIIPNAQCFRHGDAAKNTALYRAVVEKLLDSGRQVYVFRHSAEDMDICRQIKENFAKEKSVHLLENDFSCLEYDKFIRRFAFIVCSRYHGIVHAYRNKIPCIALGWAVKYKELADNVGQGRYVFDMTQESCTREGVVDAVDKMLTECRKESEVIGQRIKKIQDENCFTWLGLGGMRK